MQDRTEYRRQYRLKNKERINAAFRKWYKENREARRVYSKEYRQRNHNTYTERDKQRSKDLRLKALHRYGGTIPKCKCCGEATQEFLAFDHIDGKQREKHHKGVSWYRMLSTEPIDPNIQVLCHNCNLAKGFYGQCPHASRA